MVNHRHVNKVSGKKAEWQRAGNTQRQRLGVVFDGRYIPRHLLDHLECQTPVRLIRRSI